MSPTQVTLDPMVRGDTWLGIPSLGPITIDGQPPSAAVASARMYFRRSVLDISPAYELRSSPGSGEGAVSIDDAAAWVFSVPAQPLPLAPGKWKWDMEFTDANGFVYTFYAGTQQVNPDVTY